jgi:crotonobetainyl-CoA:carnitine CoA-transferase CaiB-like acyl-CoA transferase
VLERGGHPPVPVADYMGAFAAVREILAALLERERTGRGVRLEVSMTDEAAQLYAPAILTGTAACYRVYETGGGGRLTVAALEPRFWRRFCELVGLPNLPALAPRLPELETRLRERPLVEWLELFDGEEVCAGPVAARPALTGTAPVLGEHTEAWRAVLTG